MLFFAPLKINVGLHDLLEFFYQFRRSFETGKAEYLPGSRQGIIERTSE
jgi:hypothetical protein